MTAAETVAAGGVRLRVRPWRGRSDTAEMAAVPAGAAVSPTLVVRALERADERGYRWVVTPALPTFEWRPYLDSGFVVREHLHLLAHPLLDLPPREPVRLRRVASPMLGALAPVSMRGVGRRDRDRILRIDHAAFQPFWRLDGGALDDAVRATPSSRMRITTDDTGYALTGRAGDRGYVQRLAVVPTAQGGGLGRALVLDGLWWLRRWRVREALVNTQVGNERALALYRRLGFRSRPDGLAVLEIDLQPGSDR